MNYGERLVVELNRYRFARTVRGMLETAPVALGGGGPALSATATACWSENRASPAVTGATRSQNFTASP